MPKVVLLTIRDPDYENEFVVDAYPGVEVETIDVDLGSSFDGPKDFDPESDWGQEWLADTRAAVAHLDQGSPVRDRVEELCNLLENGQ